MGISDYDGRTALHLAAAEGHLDIVIFLLEKCHVAPSPKDRWVTLHYKYLTTLYSKVNVKETS